MQVTPLNPSHLTHQYFNRLLQSESVLNKPLNFHQLTRTLRLELDNPPTVPFKLHVVALLNGYKHKNFENLEECTLLFQYCQRYQIPLLSKKDFHPAEFPNNPFIIEGDFPRLAALEVSINRNEEIDLRDYELEKCFEMAIACSRLNVVRHLIGTFRDGSYISPSVGGRSWPYLTVPCRSGDLEVVRIFLEGAHPRHINKWDHPPEKIKEQAHTKYRYIPIEDHPIVAACQSGNVEILNLLCERGFTLHENQRIPAINAALSCGSLATLQYLFNLMDQATIQELIQVNSADFIRSAFSSDAIEVIQFLVNSIAPQDRERLLRGAEIKLLNRNLLVDILLLENGFNTQGELRKYFIDAAAKKLGILEMQLFRSKGLILDNQLILASIKKCCAELDTFRSKATKKNITFLTELFENKTVEEDKNLFEMLLESKSLNNDFILSIIKYKINVSTTFKFFLDHFVKRKEVFMPVFKVTSDYNYKFIEKLVPTVNRPQEEEALIKLLEQDLALLNKDRANIQLIINRMECLHVINQFPGLALIEKNKQELYEDQSALNFYVTNYTPHPYDARHQALVHASRCLMQRELNADFEAILTKIVNLEVA